MKPIHALTHFSIPPHSFEHPNLCQRFSSVNFWLQTSEVEKIALRALAHITIAISINVFAISFCATPISIPIITMIAMFSFTVLVGTSLHHLFFQKRVEKDPLLRKLSEGILPMANAILFHTFNTAGPSIAIHEAGHAICAWSFFKHSQPSISCSPFTGFTTYTVSHGLTFTGQLLGHDGALLITAAGGFIASMLISMISFCTAIYLSEDWPALNECFHYLAISQLVSEMIYGLTTFFVSRHDLGHDFIYLWEMGGIHPLVPLLLFSGLILLQVAIILREKNPL